MFESLRYNVIGQERNSSDLGLMLEDIGYWRVVVEKVVMLMTVWMD